MAALLVLWKMLLGQTVLLMYVCNSSHLWPDTQEAAAVWCSTFTNRLPVPQTLQVVVECELCAWTDTHKQLEEAATVGDIY